MVNCTFFCESKEQLSVHHFAAGASKIYFVSEAGVLTILCAWALAAIMYIRAKK